MISPQKHSAALVVFLKKRKKTKTSLLWHMRSGKMWVNNEMIWLTEAIFRPDVPGRIIGRAVETLESIGLRNGWHNIKGFGSIPFYRDLFLRELGRWLAYD